MGTKKVFPDLKSGPNISLLCAVDCNALQFYDIILAPFAESIWLAAILQADSVKDNYSGAMPVPVYCTVVKNEVSYNG